MLCSVSCICGSIDEFIDSAKVGAKGNVGIVVPVWLEQANVPMNRLMP